MPVFSRSSVHLDADPGERRASEPVDPDSPFRILILGDFSGRANRGIQASLGGRRPVLVDRDNIDDIVSEMHTELRLPGIDLAFSEVDDFHPDHIYSETDTF